MKITPFQNDRSLLNLSKNFVHLSLVVTAVLAFAGLSASADTATNNALAGTYTLVSVDGKKVPAQVSHHEDNVEVRSGTFTFKEDGTCSTRTVFVPPAGKVVAREVSATYSKEKTKVTMKWKGAGITTGTLEGNTFTMNNEGMTFVYRK